VRYKNILRALLFAGGAMFLIFIQNHSAQVGLTVFHFVTVALAFGGIALAVATKEKFSISKLFTPEGVSLVLGVTLLALVGGEAMNAEQQLVYLKTFVALFAFGVAGAELNLSRTEKKEDVSELRISSALGIVTGLVFALAPLNALNAVGLFSAYLALSAVQRAVWAATPNKQEKKN
jgi:hypothetical protein